MVLSKNDQRVCLFIAKQEQSFVAQEKGKGRRASRSNPPTKQWHCNWLESSSLSGASSLAAVTDTAYGWHVMWNFTNFSELIMKKAPVQLPKTDKED